MLNFVGRRASKDRAIQNLLKSSHGKTCTFLCGISKKELFFFSFGFISFLAENSERNNTSIAFDAGINHLI